MVTMALSEHAKVGKGLNDRKRGQLCNTDCSNGGICMVFMKSSKS